MLGPSDDHVIVADVPYDAASGGVLSDPSGFGAQAEAKLERPGIIGDLPPEDEYEDNGGLGGKEPSVKGALADLHHAVSGHLQSWNPYHPKPKPASTAANTTSKGKMKGGTKLKPVNPLATTFYNATLGENVTDGWNEEDRLGARTRIGKCTILFYGNEYWERAIRTHEAHDRMHGYRLHILHQQLMDDVWSKPAYILSLLLRELGKPPRERLEWLFWVDADTVILNPYIPIDTFLPPPGEEFKDVNLIYSNDWNGLNNGVFPVRVSQWAVNLFTAIMAYRHYLPDEPLQYRDQSAMNALMNDPKFVKGIVNAPQRWFNAYQGEHNETLAPFQIRRGDFLVHFAGVGDREARMDHWLQRAEQHSDEWEIPLKATSYPQEVKDFWNEERDRRTRKKNSLSEARLAAEQLLTKTDQLLNDYGDRLADDQKELIDKQRNELKVVLENERFAEDLEKMEEKTKRLEEACAPLNNAISSSQKVLLQSAHEAIFAGEKDLLEAGATHGATSGEMDVVTEAVKDLKSIVMRPQEQWDKLSVTNALNRLTDARAKLQETTASAESHRLKAVESAKQLEEEKARLQAQLEKEAAEAAGLLYTGPPIAETSVVVVSVEQPSVVIQTAFAVQSQFETVVTSVVMATITGPPTMVTVTPEPIVEFVTMALDKAEKADAADSVAKDGN